MFARVLLLAWIFLFSCVVARADQQLIFDTTKTTTHKDGKVDAPTKETLSLTLSDNYFSQNKGTETVVYDFNSRRIFRIDTATHTFIDDALISDVGFRTAEFDNRIVIGKALAAAKVKQLQMPVELSEHLFSLKDPNSKTKIAKIEKPQEILFKWQDHILFAYSKDHVEFSLHDKERFVRFLRYHLGGHPDILAELQKEDSLPVHMRFYRYNIDSDVYAIDLVSHEAIPSQSYSLSGLTQSFGKTNDPITKLLERIRSTPFNATQHASELLESARNNFENSNYLDSILAYLEYNLETGLPLPEQFQQYKATFMKDEGINLLTTSLQPANEESALKAVRNLQGLRSKTHDHRHVIMIFEANVQSQLKKPQLSRELFLKALDQNPYIPGEWKDLGDTYYAQYDMETAWRCWDIARYIKPDHPQLTGVNEYEKQLTQAHPEFF